MLRSSISRVLALVLSFLVISSKLATLVGSVVKLQSSTTRLFEPKSPMCRGMKSSCVVAMFVEEFMANITSSERPRSV